MLFAAFVVSSLGASVLAILSTWKVLRKPRFIGFVDLFGSDRDLCSFCELRVCRPPHMFRSYRTYNLDWDVGVTGLSERIPQYSEITSRPSALADLIRRLRPYTHGSERGRPAAQRRRKAHFRLAPRRCNLLPGKWPD